MKSLWYYFLKSILNHICFSISSLEYGQCISLNGYLNIHSNLGMSETPENKQKNGTDNGRTERYIEFMFNGILLFTFLVNKSWSVSQKNILQKKKPGIN